jgi:hypothetical protein
MYKPVLLLQHFVKENLLALPNAELAERFILAKAKCLSPASSEPHHKLK